MFLFILLFLMADFFVSLKVGISIGYLNSVLWIIGSAIGGVLLLKLSPYALIDTFQSFNFGQIDAKSVHSTIMSYLFGSILLIIPGVLSDAIGVLLLLYALYLQLFAKMQPQRKHYNKSNEGEYDNVIDVEIIDEQCSNDTDNNSRRI